MQVRVKEYEEILKTLEPDEILGDDMMGTEYVKGETVAFRDEMKSYCGRVIEVESFEIQKGFEAFRGCDWTWIPQWFDEITN